MFVDEVKDEGRGKSRASCKVASFLALIDATERDEIVAVLDDPAWQHAAITRALNKRGYEIKADPIGRHRRRADGTGCQCPS